MENNENRFSLIKKIKEWWENKRDNKLKRLPEPSKPLEKKERFISQYSIEKNREQLEYETSKKEIHVFYKLKSNQNETEEEYELPYFQAYMKSMKEKDIKVFLQKTGEGKYLIKDDEMTEEEKYNMLYFILNVSQNYVFTQINNFFSMEKQYEEECKKKDVISSKIYYNAKMASVFHSDGNNENANKILKEEIVRLLDYNNEYIDWVEGIESQYEK